MKHLITFIFLFSIIYQNSLYSQNNKNYLTLTKAKSGKQFYIKDNKRITIWTNTNGAKEKTKGKFSIQDSTTIKIDNQLIKINTIEKILCNNYTSRKVGGTVSIIGGTILIGSGMKFIYDIQNIGYLDYDFIISGASVLLGTFITLAGIPIFNSIKIYSIDDNITLSIGKKQ